MLAGLIKAGKTEIRCQVDRRHHSAMLCVAIDTRTNDTGLLGVIFFHETALHRAKNAEIGLFRPDIGVRPRSVARTPQANPYSVATQNAENCSGATIACICYFNVLTC